MTYGMLLPLSVVGIAFATLGIAICSHRWPRVKGVIEVSIFEAEWETTTSGPKISLEKRGKHYLAYAYSVDDVELRGSRFAPLVDVDWHVSGSPQLSSANDRSKWYRQGATVDVSYCPIWPRWSCLEPGGFGVAFMLGVTAAIIYALT